ncbi:MAG: DUF599 domain-containing protein, partial [Pseudomonadota bacterium]
MLAPILNAFTFMDFLALVALIVTWLGSSMVIENPPKARPSVTRLMNRYRSDWMMEMITRQPRIFDAAILASLRQGTTFLASGTMLAVGGVLALASNAQRLDGIVMDIGVEGHPELFWQIKLAVVALLLTYAVFKFVWSDRLFGYCAVVMASVPNDVTDARALARASQAAEINTRAALNFNRGLRAVYFAFAALGWLVGPWGLLLTVTLTTWTVLSREFAS